jgi:DNA-binding PadR family transcriptional regulator
VNDHTTDVDINAAVVDINAAVVDGNDGSVDVNACDMDLNGVEMDENTTPEDLYVGRVNDHLTVVIWHLGLLPLPPYPPQEGRAPFKPPCSGSTVTGGCSSSPSVALLSFQILQAPVDEERHWYGIMKEIERRTRGRMSPATGLLYLEAQRLLDTGLIAESAKRSAPELDDRRRKYYQLTPFGRRVAAAEAERMANLVTVAFDKHIVDGKLTIKGNEARSHEALK